MTISLCAVMRCAVCAEYHIVLNVVILAIVMLSVRTPSEELEKVYLRNLMIILKIAKGHSMTSFNITTLSITIKTRQSAYRTLSVSDTQLI